MPKAKLPFSDEVLTFWFSDEVANHWFIKSASLDETIRDRFGKIYKDLAHKQDQAWLNDIDTAEDALACIIILDQFPRNMFRDSPRAFATDSLAIEISKAAIAKGLDKQLTSSSHHNFLYMPFMHSENLADQEEGIRLFSDRPDNGGTVGFAKQHRDIILQFGRFPHRNAVLGRESTPEELEFLKSHSGF